MKTIRYFTLIHLLVLCVNAFAQNAPSSHQKNLPSKMPLHHEQKKSPVATHSSQSKSSKSSTKTASHTSLSQAESHNLWSQIIHDFALSHNVDSPDVQQQIRWYLNHPDYLQTITTDSQYYLYYVYHEVKKRHLPSELVLLPVIESAYDPFAYSWVGAAGLWQMMPKTGSSFGLNQNWWYDSRKSIKPATSAALDYLTYLHTFFNGNWPLAIAAYNAGEGRVQAAVNYNLSMGRKTSFWDLNLPTETENYVPKLLGLAEILSHPEKYHISVPNIPNTPYFETVHLNHAIVLTQAANFAHIPVETLYELNPEYIRWTTSPYGPYDLLLPISAVPTFEENLAKNQGVHAATWSYHTVKAGETLDLIAEHYQTSPEDIIKTNFLTKNTLELGETLLIPSNLNPTVSEKKSSAIEVTSTEHIIHLPDNGVNISEKSYQVKVGDTLFRIAKTHGLTVDKLREINHLSSDNAIHPGETLLTQ
jgi:membrane-bound lytic murein transglycosylase D